MTPFEEELFRLLQDSRKESNAFTTEEEDSGNDVNKIIRFARKWDYKEKFDQKIKEYEAQLTQANKEKLVVARKATKDLVKELIPIIDETFILAKFVEPGTAMDRGVKLMLNNMEEILIRRKGSIIRPIVGEELDPNRHKAISAEEVPGHVGNTIEEVYRYGYSVMGQIVREAEVKVKCGVKK